MGLRWNITQIYVHSKKLLLFTGFGFLQLPLLTSLCISSLFFMQMIWHSVLISPSSVSTFFLFLPVLPYYHRSCALSSGLDPFLFSSTGQVWRRSWKHMPFGDHLWGRLHLRISLTCRNSKVCGQNMKITLKTHQKIIKISLPYITTIRILPKKKTWAWA